MSGKTKRQKETQAFTGNKKTWREQSRLSGCSWGGGDNAAKIDLAFFMCDIFLLDFHESDFSFLYLFSALDHTFLLYVEVQRVRRVFGKAP